MTVAPIPTESYEQYVRKQLRRMKIPNWNSIIWTVQPYGHSKIAVILQMCVRDVLTKENTTTQIWQELSHGRFWLESEQALLFDWARKMVVLIYAHELDEQLQVDGEMYKDPHA